METKITFWKLLNQYSVEIPIIQRDYAQGRDDNKVNRIRDKFLNDLHENISDETKFIDLDFVYGRVNENKFIPLDGQQRLTTLFLLHWYLALKDKKLDGTKEIFHKFTYETRISSKEFCENLVTQYIDLSNEKILSEIIKNQSWFFESWQKDPTIKSMLNMIDAIHEKFQATHNLFDKLISETKPSVTFQFLNLENFELTDELYIKMNARGKPLTDFEYFKAKFEHFLSIDKKSNLDNSWTDLFWQYKDSNNVIDDRFLSFFTNMTLNFYVEDNDIEKGKKVDEISIFDMLESVYCKEENTQRIVKLLDILSEQTTKDIKNVFEIFIGFKDGDTINESESKLSYWDRARFYATALFLINIGMVNAENEEQYLNWKRVTFNLVNNTLIQRPEELMRAIRSLNNLSEKMANIYDYLRDPKCKIDFFLQSQVEEERIKASLIQDKNWEVSILNIEKHWYFDGQIGFILEFSKQNEKYDRDQFEIYSKRLEQLFDKKVLDSKNFLVQRALLTKGDYLIYIKSNFTFCSSEAALRTKQDNWRKVFNDDEKRLFLKQLLDETNIESISQGLQKVIDGANINDWREHFVKTPEVLKYCKNLQTRFIRIGDENDDRDEILLLQGERTNGNHAEYYSYALYLELKKLNIQNLEYTPQKSVELLKLIKLGDKEIFWNNEERKYEYDGKKYTFSEIRKELLKDNA